MKTPPGLETVSKRTKQKSFSFVCRHRFSELFPFMSFGQQTNELNGVAVFLKGRASQPLNYKKGSLPT